jgi:hypothetical protein
MGLYKVTISDKNAAVLYQDVYTFCLNDDVYEWLICNIGEPTYDFTYVEDITENTLKQKQWAWDAFDHVIVFIFKNKEKAMLFKLLWSGNL